jgi:hypothetical protein
VSPVSGAGSTLLTLASVVASADASGGVASCPAPAVARVITGARISETSPKTGNSITPEKQRYWSFFTKFEFKLESLTK